MRLQGLKIDYARPSVTDLVMCKNCNCRCVKNGFTSNRKQRYKCTSCGKRQLIDYTYKAYSSCVDDYITLLLKEGVGIRSMSRLLRISASTVISRIKKIAAALTPPLLYSGNHYEVDELCTFIRVKTKRIWIVSAFCRQTNEVVRVSVGARTNKTIRRVTDTIILAKASRIYTDKLKQYRFLIPKTLHLTTRYGTNRIERMHLNMRTHLKRLIRRGLGYSKSTIMLKSTVKIYLWA